MRVWKPKRESVSVCVCVSGRNVLGTSSTWLCNAYLDFTGILSAVDVVKGLFDGLPESNHAVIPQHQNLEHAHTEKVIVSIRRVRSQRGTTGPFLQLVLNETVRWCLFYLFSK